MTKIPNIHVIIIKTHPNTNAYCELCVCTFMVKVGDVVVDIEMLLMYYSHWPSAIFVWYYFYNTNMILSVTDEYEQRAIKNVEFNYYSYSGSHWLFFKILLRLTNLQIYQIKWPDDFNYYYGTGFYQTIGRPRNHSQSTFQVSLICIGCFLVLLWILEKWLRFSG